jgi:hypothetical protein
MSAVAERPWQPHERNYSGNRVGVWFSDEWTILNVCSGGAETTTSIRDHEAWDLASRLSPKLVERMEFLFDKMKEAQNALHQFTWADTIAPLLRKVADDWDCESATCEFAWSDMGGLACQHMESEKGCRAVEADELRQFANALEVAADLRAASCDTHPKDGDVKQAPLVSGAVAATSGETPNLHSETP